MSLILSGSDGLSDIDGSAATPAIRGTDANTGIFFPAADTIAFSEGGVEAARFDSAGNLGLGTSSPATKLNIGSGGAIRLNRTDNAIYGDISYAASNGFVFNDANGDGYTFQQGASTKVRIDSSGRFLVGTTSPVGSTFSTIEYSAATYNGLALNQSTNSGGGRFMLFASQNTQCGVIDRVGATSAVVYTTTSDRRLKENIVNAPSAIAHINAVKVRSYNWIEGGHQVKYGVIAQEFVDVEPDAVVQGDTGQTVEKSWAVDTSALVPAMIKAIQEQQALITQLQADVAALKAV